MHAEKDETNEKKLRDDDDDIFCVIMMMRNMILFGAVMLLVMKGILQHVVDSFPLEMQLTNRNPDSCNGTYVLL